MNIIDLLTRLHLSHWFTYLLHFLICFLCFRNSFLPLLLLFLVRNQLMSVLEQYIAVEEFKWKNDGHCSNAKNNHVLTHEECALIHTSSIV